MSRIELPNLLFTTSRKTSNRVRTFIRDLVSLLPEAERFNRGGMGLPELVSRINQQCAKAAVVVSIWKGNPGDMTFLSPTGEETINIRLESVQLRREVSPTISTRTSRVEKVVFKSDSSEQVRNLAKDIASLLNIDISEQATLGKAMTENTLSFIWFDDIDSGRILWTHYNGLEGLEIGPRIRISTVRRK